MEFLEILALAREKQEKRDKEVKKMVQEENLKRARLREIEKARASSKLLFVTKNGGVPEIASTQLPTSNSDQNSSCIGKAPAASTGEAKSREPPAPVVASTCSEKTNDNSTPRSATLKSAPKNRCNLSFTELLELAKKNVPSDAGKRVANEDLLPCPRNSSYRSLDSAAPSKKKLTHNHSTDGNASSITTSTGKLSTDREVQPVAPCSLSRLAEEPNNPKLSTKVAKSFTHPPSVDRISAHSSGQNSPKRKKEKLPPRRSKSAIADQLGSHQKCPPTKVSIPHIARRRTAPESEKNVKSRCDINAVEGKVARLENRPTVQPREAQTSLVSKTPSSRSALPSNLGIAVQRKDDHKADSHPKEPSSRQPQTLPARGIAAQLRSCLDNGRELANVNFSEVDDYESDDSFIDDSEAMESKDYARIVRDVHKALKFDPRKYKEVNPWDDLSSMEANFRDIDREEKRSARLAAQEDAAELEKELLRKKQKKRLSR